MAPSMLGKSSFNTSNLRAARRNCGTFDSRVKDPDYPGFAPGRLRMHWKTYRIVSNQQTQENIAKIRESLIPAHQKDLPADDQLKIPFRCYLVEARNFNS
jgi:hypothetical protein